MRLFDGIQPSWEVLSGVLPDSHRSGWRGSCRHIRPSAPSQHTMWRSSSKHTRPRRTRPSTMDRIDHYASKATTWTTMFTWTACTCAFLATMPSQAGVSAVAVDSPAAAHAQIVMTRPDLRPPGYIYHSGASPHQDALPSFSLVHAIQIGADRYPGLQVQRAFNAHESPVMTSQEQERGEAPLYDLCTASLRTIKQSVWRPSHPPRSPVYEAARRVNLRKSDASIQELAAQLTWEEVEVDAPDVTDVDTLSALAKMASNAYSVPDSGWYDISNDTLSDGKKYNLSSSFGWKEDGLRGHIFSSGPANESIVIALKGTSAFVGGSPTGRNDKLNDNLLFSCCCARIDWTWTPVCDCYAGRGEEPSPNETTSSTPIQANRFQSEYVNRCNLTCLEDALIEKSVYYPLATDLFNNITAMYPRSNIWITGHSLGGSLAALLAATFGVPCVTFEAPGDMLAARRLHLPLPPGYSWDDKRPDFGITHVYTNSDPIPQGVCTGAFSTCNLVGFALEARCHTGQTIIYDAVGKLGWSVDVRTHRIATLIEKLLVPDWDSDAGEPSSTSAIHLASQYHRQPASIWASLRRWPWPRRGDKGKNPPEDDGTDGNEPNSPGNGGSKPDKNHPPSKSHVPKAEIDHECKDCFKWEFFDDFA